MNVALRVCVCANVVGCDGADDCKSDEEGFGGSRVRGDERRVVMNR